MKKKRHVVMVFENLNSEVLSFLIAINSNSRHSKFLNYVELKQFIDKLKSSGTGSNLGGVGTFDNESSLNDEQLLHLIGQDIKKYIHIIIIN